MKKIVKKEIEKIDEFITKNSKKKFFNNVDDYNRDFQKLNWDTQSFCKIILLNIQKKIRNYNDYINTNDNLFLEDLEYSENRISYGEDMNLFSDYSPSEIINKFLSVLRLMESNLNE